MPPPPAAGGEPSGKRPRWRGTRLLVGILVLAVLALAATLAAVLATRGGNSSATASESSGTSFSVAMTGSAEVPKSISNAASGTAKVTVNGTDVCWDFKLNGVDEPNAAHIHRGGPSVSGPVVVPLGGKFSRKGCTTATKAAAREILADPGNHYVNVHSVTFPDGVVRGQLSTAAAPYEAAPATKE